MQNAEFRAGMGRRRVSPHSTPTHPPTHPLAVSQWGYRRAPIHVVCVAGLPQATHEALELSVCGATQRLKRQRRQVALKLARPVQALHARGRRHESW